mmetsp:Transcript_14619/g.29983  ORF Transcript_14619/g.29983 Transcript_14619/m.29983 type:complete len:1930 (-) Transcript_14619:32-5821(-)
MSLRDSQDSDHLALVEENEALRRKISEISASAAEVKAKDEEKIKRLEMELGEIRSITQVESNASLRRLAESSGKAKVHQNMMKKLIERGAVEGIIDQSSKVSIKKTEFGEVVHTEPSEILKFLLSESEKGAFRRHTIEKFDRDDGATRIIYWQHFTQGSRVFEYLLNVQVNYSENVQGGGYTLNMSSVNEEELSEDNMSKFMLYKSYSKNARSVKFNGEWKLEAHDYGQTLFSLVGTLESFNDFDENAPGSSNSGRLSNRLSKGSGLINRLSKARQRFSGGGGFSLKGGNTRISMIGGRGSSRGAFSSVLGIFNMVQKKFRKPDIIDERRKKHFMEEVIPNAPELTSDEKNMLKKIGSLETHIYSKGKRISGTLKEGIDKYLWREKGKDWACFVMLADCSAKRLLADTYDFDTYRGSQEYKANHGNLTRKISKNINGTRSLFFRNTLYVPTTLNPRVFDLWFCWKEIKSSNGKTSYLVGFVPLTDYPGRNSEKKKFGPTSSTVATVTGIHVVEEVTANISRWTRVMYVDLKANLLKPALLKVAKSELRWANTQKEKYRRNDKRVDMELREEIIDQMKSASPGRGLESDQIMVFQQLDQLFGGEEDAAAWKKEKTNLAGVKLWFKKHKDAKTKRNILLGKCQRNADCTAAEATAWYFDFASRERSFVGREEGNSIRFQIRKETKRTNERLYAYLKMFKFPLMNRKFVTRFIWRKNSNESMSVGVWSVNENADWGGAAARSVTGTTYALFTATNIANIGGVPQCELTLNQYFDLNGYVPPSKINQNMPQVLGTLNILANSFSRDKDIDFAEFEKRAEIMKSVKQIYSPDETKALQRGLEFHKKCEDSGIFSEITSPDNFVKMKTVHIDGESLVTGKAMTVVDASAEQCAAFEYNMSSREALKYNTESGIYDVTFNEINEHAAHYFSTRKLPYKILKDRVSRNKIIWKKEHEGDDKGLVIMDVSDTVDLLDEIPMTEGAVRVVAHTFWMFKPLLPIGDVPQTEVHITTKVDFKGKIPTSVVNAIAPKFLSVLSHLRKHFDKSKNFDKINRALIIERMNTLLKVDKEMFDAHFTDFKDKERVRGSFPLAETFFKAQGKGKGWGKTTIKVRAPIEEVAAFFWDFDSRTHLNTTGDIERVITKRKGEWEISTRRRQKLTSGHGGTHRNREFLNSMKMYRVSKNTIVITLTAQKDQNSKLSLDASNLSELAAGPSPTSTNLFSNSSLFFISSPNLTKRRGRFSRKFNPKVIEASEGVTIRFTRNSKMTTKVEFVTRLELGRGVSDESTKLALQKHLDEAAEAERYFADLVELKDMTTAVGEALGADMVWDGGQLEGKSSRSDKLEHIKDVCQKSLALREVMKKYPWFLTMLLRARVGNLAFNSVVKTKLECISEKEARVLGNNLMPCMKSRKVIGAGVDLWSMQNRAIGELFKEFPWMRSMFIALGQGIVKTAPWGLMFRVSFGACTSGIDLITDIYVTLSFLEDKRYYGYFLASAVSLGVSLGFQLLLIVAQYRKMGWQRVLKEAFPVFIGFKPAVDAYRVSNGAQMEVGQAINALEELTAIKLVEMFSEAIPGVIIQLMAITTKLGDKKDINNGAWISLAVSLIATGFIGATVSYDYDTDPKKRESAPEFYGYVPSHPTKRTIVYASLLAFSAGMLLIRCFTIVLLGLISSKWVFFYIGADLGLYLTVKMLRADFFHWIPFEGSYEIVGSILTRIIIKVITDFTSIVHFRHPNEVGGFYWIFGFVLTMGSLPATIHFYQRQGGDDSIAENAWVAVNFAIPFTAVAFIIFLTNIEAGYRDTFFSTMTAPDYAVKNFKIAESDEARAHFSILRSKHHWQSIEEEVRIWVETNWEIWEESKPKWFDETTRAMVPVAYIPTPEGRARESMRRSVRKSTSQSTRKSFVLTKILGQEETSRGAIVPVINGGDESNKETVF